MNLALLSLFLASFSIGTTEFVVAGLLPEISRDLSVSIPTAGFLVSGYAAGVAIGGPLMAPITSKVRRKLMVLILMALFIAGHLLGAVSVNYTMLMVARVVISFSHGSFFGLAGIIAVSIAAPDKRGSALALVFGGISVANVLGVPLGTAIGNALGWRATFWTVASLALIAAGALAYALPHDVGGNSARPGLMAQIRALRHHKVFMTYGIIILSMIGFFSFFTFVAPLLINVTGVSQEYVPLLLLINGVGATIGIFLGGRLSDWRPQPTILLSLPLQCLVFGLILLVAGSPVGMAIALLFMGVVTMLPTTPMQNRILSGAADAPDLASTLISSVYNIGIAAGSALSAVALQYGINYVQIPWIGVVLTLVAIPVVVLTLRLERSAAA